VVNRASPQQAQAAGYLAASPLYPHSISCCDTSRLYTHACAKDVLEKYTWIAERHNRVVCQIAERYADPMINFDECIISGAQPTNER
jgi:hypothetical protein